MALMGSTEDQSFEALLQWYADMGVDHAVGRQPADLYSWTARSADRLPMGRRAKATGAPVLPMRNQARPATPAAQTTVFKKENAGVPADEAIALARQIAAGCSTFEALEAAVMAFEGCQLKAGCKNTVFADGTQNSDLLVIGEAPGRDEDQLGKPFVGRAGQLLDKMLAAIGRSRETNTLITNIIYWRPPGNRTPTAVETAICKPFVEQLIELTKPKAILLAGGAPMQTLLGITGIMRQRGTWRDIELANGTRIPAIPIFHPAFLLRQPAQKRQAWTDLQSLGAALKDS